MRLSYSRISDHRACPQAWAFGQLDQLERAEENTPVELDYGTWWHAVMAVDSIERGLMHNSLRYVQDYIDTPAGKLPERRLIVESIFEAAAAWWSLLSPGAATDWEERLGITNLERHLRDRFTDWSWHWEKDNDEERPLAVELWWERELPGTDLVLVGKIDEVYYDTRRGVVVIRDHKTGKLLDKGSTSLGDMMDGQLHLYSWGAGPTLAQLGIEAPRAVAYDRARSSASKEPKLTNAGKLSAAVKDYSVWDYHRWCRTDPTYPGTKKDGSGAGIYRFDPDVESKLAAPEHTMDWFQRSLDPLNPNVVAAHLREATHTAADIERTRAAHAAGGEPGRNLGRSCQWCPFAKMCRAQMIGGRDGEYDLAVMGLRRKERRDNE